MSKEPTNQEVITQITVLVKQHVDERFEDLAGMFNKYASYVEKRFDRVDLGLFDVNQRLGKVENRLTKVEGSVGDLYTLVDGAMKKADTVKQDQVATINWLKRHDRQIGKSDL